MNDNLHEADGQEQFESQEDVVVKTNLHKT